jgi:hypothetical protein
MSVHVGRELERELTAVTEQRDMLKEALRKIKNAGGIHNDPYDELDFIDGITYEALQSLTTNHFVDANNMVEITTPDHFPDVSNMIEEFRYGVGEGSRIDRVPFIKTNHHIENMEINEQNENDDSGLDYLEDEEMLKMDGFNDCIIGIVEQFGRPAIYCYDKDKVLAKLMAEGMDEEEAVDWFCFNQVSAWVGDTTPCFVTLDPTLAEE